MFSKLDNFLWKHEKKIKIITLLLALVAGFFAVSSWKKFSYWSVGSTLSTLCDSIFSDFFRAFLESKIFGTLLKFREEIGILIGVLSLAHLYQMLPYIEMFAKSKPILVIFGILPQIIILILTLIPTNFSKKLGKNWKKLHRLAYIVPILIMIQIGLAKIGRFFRSPFSILYS